MTPRTRPGELRVRQQGRDRLLETGLRRGVVASALDGRRFALVDLAGAVRVYDAATLLPVGTPLETGQLLAGLGFTADGAHVVTSGSFADERWVVSAETNELVAFLPATGGVRAPSIDAAGVAYIWDLAVDDRPVADWVDIAALYASARSTPAGRVPVSIGEVAVLWERLSRVYPEQFQPE